MWQLLNFFNPHHYGRRREDEIPDYIKDYITLPRGLFKISLIGGTLLTLAYFFSHYDGLLIIGLFYVVIAVIINLILFGVFVVMAIINYRYAIFILQKASVQLINIPIAFLYLNIIFPGTYTEF